MGVHVVGALCFSWGRVWPMVEACAREHRVKRKVRMTIDVWLELIVPEHELIDLVFQSMNYQTVIGPDLTVNQSMTFRCGVPYHE